MAARKLNPYLIYGGLGAAAWVLWRRSQGLPIIPSASAPINATATAALPAPGTPGSVGVVAPIAPPLVLQPASGGVTYPGAAVATPLGPYYPSNFGPSVPAGTPADVAVCFAKKSGNGWTVQRCAERLDQLKAAYRQAMSQSVANENQSVDAGIAAANAEIERYRAAIASHTAALAAETNPSRRLAWETAIGGFNQAIGEIQGRIASLRSQGVNSGGWAKAAAGHKADYFALTGMVLA